MNRVLSFKSKELKVKDITLYKFDELVDIQFMANVLEQQFFKV